MTTRVDGIARAHAVRLVPGGILVAVTVTSPAGMDEAVKTATTAGRHRRAQGGVDGTAEDGPPARRAGRRGTPRRTRSPAGRSTPTRRTPRPRAPKPPTAAGKPSATPHGSRYQCRVVASSRSPAPSLLPCSGAAGCGPGVVQRSPGAWPAALARLRPAASWGAPRPPHEKQAARRTIASWVAPSPSHPTSGRPPPSALPAPGPRDGRSARLNWSPTCSCAAACSRCRSAVRFRAWPAALARLRPAASFATPLTLHTRSGPQDGRSPRGWSPRPLSAPALLPWCLRRLLRRARLGVTPRGRRPGLP